MLPHLPARKFRPIEMLIYHTLVRPALRRSFQRIAINNLAPPALRPTLIYMNHPSWWDGYMPFFLSDELWRREGYIMMEEPQLRRYSFFRYCGAFSVDRHNPREGLRSLAYAANLLDRAARIVWIFPQGTLTPSDRRPLETFAGTAHIAKRAAPVQCIPIALRPEFGQHQRPEMFVRIGPAHVVEAGVAAKTLHADMDARLLHEMDQLRSDVIDGTAASYHTVLRGRDSVNVVWDRARATVLRRSR